MNGPQMLSEWRLAKELSQTAAGELVGVSQVTWSDWESGKKCPHVGQAVKIARVTGVPCAAWEALADEQRRRLQARREQARAVTHPDPQEAA